MNVICEKVSTTENGAAMQREPIAIIGMGRIFFTNFGIGV